MLNLIPKHGVLDNFFFRLPDGKHLKFIGK